jgi:tetratricopeptide (TPR) repeat protein
VVGEVDAGVSLIERALRLNPNLMDAWLSSGLIRFTLGKWNLAVEHFARAIRLSPFDPFLFLMQLGIASGHFKLAAMTKQRRARRNPLGKIRIIHQHGGLWRRATRF